MALIKSLFIFFVVAFSSCKENDLKKENGLFNEWRWESTWSQTAEKLDTTYYWKFQDNGILQIKNVNKQIKSEVGFKITSSEQFSGTFTITDPVSGEWHYMYSIKENTLHLTNIDGIVATPSIFILAN